MGNTRTISLKIWTALVLLVLPLNLHAQFSTMGDDPGRVRWSRLKTEHYRLVYPRGMDSLARVYAEQLERYRTPVSWSGGYAPAEFQRRPFPVILHAYGGSSNASVVWAPKRMDIFTLPDPYDPDPMGWEKNLAIHESRHVSQMQLGYDGLFKPLNWLVGELMPSAAAALYANQSMMEGDAVVAETALSSSGRGRSGDFLNYYMSAFDGGDRRDWYRWKYGSWRYYTPNHYAFGYMYLAGTRVFYDDPLFMDGYYRRIRRNPVRFDNLGRGIKKASGLKFKPAFQGIMEGFNRVWEENASSRAPFVGSEPVMDTPAWFEEYRSPVMTSAGLLALRSGLVRSTTLVSISPEGEVRDLRPFASGTSSIAYDPNLDRLYWSETVRDVRWSLAADSRIRYIDLSRGMRIHDLTVGSRLYNPSPSPDGQTVAAVSYGYAGDNSIVFLSSGGQEISSVRAPQGIRPVDLVWKDGRTVVFSAVYEDGMGLWSYDGEFRELVPRTPVRIKNLSMSEEGVLFSSDRTGVNEIYCLSGTEVFQKTVTRYGADDAISSGDGLYYTMLQTGLPRGKRSGEGRLLYRSSDDGLLERRVDFADVYRDPVAEALSAQEKELGGDVDNFASAPVNVSESSSYSKALNIFRFHSWCPLRVDYDNFSSLNMDVVTNLAGLGATAFYQNDLGTANGSIAYGYNPFRKDGYGHSGHLRLNYSGLYPVFDIDIDFGGRPAYQYIRYNFVDGDSSTMRVASSYREEASFRSKVQVYVPLRFSSGGWYSGVTPRVTWLFSNDRYDRSQVRLNMGDAVEESYYVSFDGIDPAANIFMNRVSASVTAYAVEASAPSLEYPRLGMGLELGMNCRLGLSDIYSSGAYLYAYGYLPGIWRQQGLRLTGLWQHSAAGQFMDTFVNMLPRGLSSASVLLPAGADQMKFTADYAAPLRLEFGLGSAFRVTHAMVKPHFDWAWFASASDGGSSLCSAGAELSLRLANFLWLPFPTSIGVVVDLNSGPLMKHPEYSGLPHTHVGLCFNMDL